MTAPEPSEARAAAVLVESADLAGYIRDARSTEDPCPHWVGQSLAVCAPCLRDRIAPHVAAALAAAGLLADPTPTAADGGLREAVEALCDAAEYVVLAVDDPGCPPVKAVAEIDLRAALAAHPAPVPDQQAVAAVLAAHRYLYSMRGHGCDCGQRFTSRSAHDVHLADRLDAALTATAQPAGGEER